MRPSLKPFDLEAAIDLSWAGAGFATLLGVVKRIALMLLSEFSLLREVELTPLLGFAKSLNRWPAPRL